MALLHLKLNLDLLLMRALSDLIQSRFLNHYPTLIKLQPTVARDQQKALVLVGKQADTLRQLAQLGVTDQFARQQIPQFVTYWHSRNVPHHSWESKFIKEVWREWQKRLKRQVSVKEKEVPMTSDWRPSQDALNILTGQGGIRKTLLRMLCPSLFCIGEAMAISQVLGTQSLFSMFVISGISIMALLIRTLCRDQ